VKPSFSAIVQSLVPRQCGIRLLHIKCVMHYGFITSKLLAITLALLFCTVTTKVQADPVTAPNLLYGALDFGRTTVKDICQSTTGWVPGCEDRAKFQRIAVGFQVSPQFAVEASYGKFGKASFGSSGGYLGDWQAEGFQFAFIGSKSLAPGLSVLGKVGYAGTKLKVVSNTPSSDGSWYADALAFGVGVQYEIAQKVSLRTQYDYWGKMEESALGTITFSALSAGIIFRF